MRYVKLNLSFGDKLRLLFLGVVPENKLPEVTKIIQVQDDFNHKKPERPPLVELSDEINKDDGFHIPFFSEDKDVKTNF